MTDSATDKRARQLQKQHPETKPGLQTTEFWGALATILGGGAAAGTDSLPKSWVTVGMFLVSAAYVISRGIAKHGVKPGP